MINDKYYFFLCFIDKRCFGYFYRYMYVFIFIFEWDILYKFV